MQFLSKHQLLAGLALALTVASCRSHDDNPVNPIDPAHVFDTAGVTMDASSGATNLHQLDTAHFTASGSGITDPANVVWLVDGDTVARGKTFTFTQRLPGDYEVILRQGSKGLARKVSVRPRFSKGMLLLNEGNFGDGTGEITYIDAKHNIVIDSAFHRVNPRNRLGNVSQDLAFAGDKIYIVSQNGPKNGGDGMLMILKQGSLELLHIYNEPILTSKMPTHIAVVGETIYLRTEEARGEGAIYAGTATGDFEKIAGTEGAKKMRMVTIGQRVYAIAGTNKILVLQGKQVIGSYTLPKGAIASIAPAEDGNLWIAYTGPSTLAKLNADPRDLKLIDSHAVQPDFVAGWGAAPILWAHGDKLYFPASQGGSPSAKIYEHDFISSTTKLAFDFATLDKGGNLKTYYNSLGVDHEGRLFFAALEGWGAAYKNNRIAVTGGGLTEPVLRDGVNAFPAGFYPIPAKKK